MLNYNPSLEPDLPSEGEIYGYNKNNNINNNQNFKNNNDNSNANILNQQGNIPLNKYFNKPDIKIYSSRGKRNENKNESLYNKENKSISNFKASESAAPAFVPKGNNNNNIIDKNEKNENTNKNFEYKISEVKSLKSQLSSHTQHNQPQPIIINVKSNEKHIKCKDISFLVLFYLSSITNNIILYFFQSIIEKIRGIY